MISNDMMNAQDVARVLHLGKNTVYQLAKTGQLASYRVGRKLRFSMEDVEAYMMAAHAASVASGQTGPMGLQKGALAQEAPDTGEPLAAQAPAAPDGALSAAASFGVLAGEQFRIAGEDVAADVLANMLNAQGVPVQRLVRGSYTALVNLYAGDADAAVVDLYDLRSNSYNIPYVRSLAPGASVVVITLYERAVGFAVAAGNPKRIGSWGALLREGVRIANQAKGSGARVLLDEKLRALEARAETIPGYESRATTGLNAVRRVANGAADVAVSTEREASRVAAVDFVELQRERVDIVIAKTPRTREFIRRIEDILSDPRTAADLAAIQPCDTSRIGSIVYES